ncbi:FadR/GntR family transcriptional regulator [Jeotgalibacillus proteolyticus]|uniref:GntR family transcriptional regulator n=1 Tax=Jeotgalibacillus proteolyticus TaxID=2082395 RepID=A0A2S5G7S5_9BACL|nr:FadR/GntR family transcriptional regulator [Jeotgalibacillus proteolyticus]PPA69047.1 GntR family transcriptional regulator [Jeotgalibacillus proteolyticus]
MAFKQVQAKKISEVICEQLEQMIREGEIKPGEKLDSVEKLAREFNVSRSAVREAQSALRAMGLITIKQGEGTFVNKYDFSTMVSPVSPENIITKKEILELFQLRKIIEVGAASLAAEHRTEQQLAEMKKSLFEMKQTEGDQDLGEKADMKFHLCIAEAAGNSLIIDMMQRISNTLSKTMYESRRISLFTTKQTFTRLQTQHEAIYEAIKAMNSKEANRTMLEHLVNVEGTLIDYHEQR